MADNTVGKINFQVGIDTSKVAAGVAQAKAEAERVANAPSAGGGGGRGPNINAGSALTTAALTSAGVATASTVSNIGKAAEAATNLRSLISRIAWPIALITGGVRIAQLINDANIRLNEFNDSVKKTGEEYTKTAAAITVKPIDDPIREKRIENAKAAEEAIAKIQEDLLKQTDNKRLVFERAFFGRLFGAESVGEMTRQAKRGIDKIIDDQEKVNKELDKLEAEALQKRVDAEAEIRRKARDERLNENARIEREATEASLTDRERIEYDFNNRLYEAKKLQAQAESQFEVDQTTRTIAKINSARFKALADYDRKVQESASTQAQDLTKALSAAVSSIQKSNAELLPVKDIIFSIEQVREGIAALGRQSQAMGNDYGGGDF